MTKRDRNADQSNARWASSLVFMLIGGTKGTRILCRSRVMTRVASFSLDLLPFFLSFLHPVLLFIFLSLFSFFFFFLHSHSAFVLACLYTGHAFPRNGSAYELRARWEYGWNEISDGKLENTGSSNVVPPRTGNRARIVNLYKFYKTCRPRSDTRYSRATTTVLPSRPVFVYE